MKLLKFLLLGAAVLTALLSAACYFVLHTESGAAWAWHQVRVLTDGSMSGEFVHGNLADGLEIEELNLSQESFDLSVGSLKLAINVDVLPLEIKILRLHLDEVKVAVRASDVDDEEPLNVRELLVGLQLPLRVDLIDASIRTIEISTTDVEPVSIEGIDISAYWFDSVDIRSFEIRNQDDSASISGAIALHSPQPYELLFSASYDSKTVDSRISGNADGAEISDIRVSGEEVDAAGSATVDWTDQFEISAGLVIERFEPGYFFEGWPSDHPVRGSSNVEITGEHVRLSESSLFIANTDASLELDADLDRASSSVAANLRWNQLRWPIAGVTAEFESEDGNVSVQGLLDDWQVQGSVSIRGEDIPAGRFQVDGNGSLDDIALRVDDGQLLGGSLSGDVAYSWRAEQAWSGEVEFEKLSIAGVLPDWPGELSGSATASGSLTPFTIDANVRGVSGQLRGRPLEANGSISHAADATYARDFALKLGAAEFLLDGSVNSAEGLAFKASVDELESLTEFGAGAFEAEGSVSRAAESERVSIDLSSSSLNIGDIGMRGLRIVDTRQEGAIAGFDLHIEALEVAGQNLTDIELAVLINQDQQLIGLRGDSDGVELALQLDGAFDDWKSVPDSTWRGHATSLTIDVEGEQALSLVDPAAIEFSAGRFALSKLCVADSETSRLCAAFALDNSGHIDLEMSMQQVPLALLEHVEGIGLRFDQRLNGELSWKGDPDAGATGFGQIQLSPGSVRSARQSKMMLATGEGQMTFEISEGDLLSGAALLPMPGLGRVDGEFSIVDFTDVDESTVSGYLDLVMTDISVLANLSPLIDSAGGRVNAHLEIAGEASDPLFTGQVVLEGGSFDYHPLGLRLDEVDLEALLTEDRAFELSGDFRAGAGLGRVVSSASYRGSSESGIRFKVQGEALRVIDLPDIQLDLTPDFEVALDGQVLNFNGSVLIPSARISPSNIGDAMVEESEDVVIVAGRQDDDPQQSASEDGLSFDGLLKVELGDQVLIDLDVAKASLAGSAVFDWQGPPMPIVEGRYDLLGDIQVFGQVLKITEGAIRYPKVPANEPDLRIRAEREIYGNAQVRVAGVLVDGAATHPTIEAYTYPRTTEERALTLLVTGSDFDYEQGVGAIDFGTYIAPRLFVSYGVGVFDRENIVGIRYDLKKGFGIKATSGQNSSGVDLNYRIDN